MEIKHWVAVTASHLAHAAFAHWLVKTRAVVAETILELIYGAVRRILGSIRKNKKGDPNGKVS